MNIDNVQYNTIPYHTYPPPILRCIFLGVCRTIPNSILWARPPHSARSSGHPRRRANELLQRQPPDPSLWYCTVRYLPVICLLFAFDCRRSKRPQDTDQTQTKRKPPYQRHLALLLFHNNIAFSLIALLEARKLSCDLR